MKKVYIILCFLFIGLQLQAQILNKKDLKTHQGYFDFYYEESTDKIYLKVKNLTKIAKSHYIYLLYQYHRWMKDYKYIIFFRTKLLFLPSYKIIPMSAKGILIPIGGNENKGIETSEIYHLEYILDGILSRVVKESGGKDALIIIIPTASSIPKEVGENYLSAFEKLGCTNLHVMDIREREESEDPVNIELIKKANCIMFSGGNQSKITEKIGGTSLHKIMLDRYKTDPLVIAGTSAGAMCMSLEMITGGSSTEAFIKGAVGMGAGMNFIPDLIIDSHFIRRGRFGRLAEAVESIASAGLVGNGDT